MAMKPVFKFLVATGVCVAANASYAHYNWVANPYLGLEYKLSYTQGKDYWKRLLPTNKPNNNGTLFAGLKFHDCLAGEIGFTKSNKRSKVSDTSGFNMFGGVENPGSQQEVKLSYRSWHLDLNGQYPAGDSFAFLGTVGLASSKPKLEITNLGNTANSSITTISGKSKMIPRLGVGVQYTQGMFGVRSRVMWEGTSRLRFNNGSYTGGGSSATDKPFKSTYSWTLGAFVRW
jgi:hypothetical protein